MKKKHILPLLSGVIFLFFLPGLVSGSDALIPTHDVLYSFVVTMENPGNHYFHVEMTCADQQSEYIDFKMPVWTPGYYAVQNNSKNVVHFVARNATGKLLAFSKQSKNTWRVNTRGESSVIISYEVYAPELSVVGSCLNASKAFISPTSLYMFPDGQINQPSLVKLVPYESWKNISTGLDLVDNDSHTYFAANFDVLFDCPTLIGNQQVYNFEVRGVPHSLSVSEKDTLDKTRFISDLKNIVESATALMGEMPYSHYAFITIGSDGGGMEHSNSCALSCNSPVSDTSNMEEYKDWLSFVTHEYFHLFNVKRIRPIALGPFDYDHECYTNMLWVSEGFTVYYEYLILNRAGIFNRADCYKYFTQSITGYENRPGHLMEPVTSSSYDAWIHYFSPNGDARNNTISYYDKGCALGFFLDLRIRQATDSKKSLDDVMRGLYTKYHKGLKRGFTDDEFKALCEEMAGTSLDDIFTLASTVNPIDYPRYFDLAGLSIDTTAHVIEGEPNWGATVYNEGGEWLLRNVVRDGPAWKAGLGNNAKVLAFDGGKADADTLEAILKTKSPGDSLIVTVSIDGKTIDVPVTLQKSTERTFAIGPSENPSAKQKKLLDHWLF